VFYYSSSCVVQLLLMHVKVAVTAVYIYVPFQWCEFVA